MPQTLPKAQPRNCQRVFGNEKTLDGALGPANPLAGVAGHGFGGQTGAQFFGQIDNTVASGGQFDAGEIVFTERAGDKATDSLEGTAADNKRSAGADNATNTIPHGLNLAIENFFFGSQLAI